MTFSKDEMFTATQIVRNFSAVLNGLSKNPQKRALIVKNNKFEAVLLEMVEYERLIKAEELLRTLYEQHKRSE